VDLIVLQTPRTVRHLPGSSRKDLDLAASEYYEDEQPKWSDPEVRDDYHDDFKLILPIVSLCRNLVSLEIYDVHLPALFQLGHGSLEVIILKEESTLAWIAQGDFYDYEEDKPVQVEFDSFEKVSIAIHELEKSKFPQLKTIRFAGRGSTWEAVLDSQCFEDYGPWGLERRLDFLGIELVDGAGVKWTQSVAKYVEYAAEEDGDEKKTDDGK